MRKFLIFVLSAVALYATAQGRYCKNYDDFVAGQWTELPDTQKGSAFGGVSGHALCEFTQFTL